MIATDILSTLLLPSPSTTPSAALPLLTMLLQEDKTGYLQQSILRQGDLPLALLTYLQQHLTPSLLDMTSASTSASTPALIKQQREQTHQVLLLLTALAMTMNGAISLLTLSMFATITHCPLVQAIRDSQYGLTPHQLSMEQRVYFRSVLAELLLVVLQVYSTVEASQSLYAELTSVIQSLLPLTTFLFKYEEEEKVEAVRLIGLYLGILVILAKHPKQFRSTLPGYDSVLERQVIGFIHMVTRDGAEHQQIAKQMTERTALTSKKHRQVDLTGFYRVAVENGMMYLSQMGIRIGDEYINGFGLKKQSA